MNMGSVLDLLLALGLLYFLFSTLVSILYEWYSYKVQKRGRFLQSCIFKLLNDPVNGSYGALLFQHYSIDKLKKNNNSYPQYIPSSMFADALIDIIGRQSEELYFENIMDDKHNILEVKMTEQRIKDPYTRFGKGLEKMKYSPLKSYLRSLYEKSNSYPELKKIMEDWYNDYMGRVSGWYKNSIKNELFVISLFVALIFNLDAIRVITKLHEDVNLRKKLIERVGLMIDQEKNKIEESMGNDDTGRVNDSNKKEGWDNMTVQPLLKIDSIVREMESEGLPVGYHGDIKKTHGDKYWLKWLLGILISAFAMSFGAPFWFEVLQKFFNIRRSGKKY